MASKRRPERPPIHIQTTYQGEQYTGRYVLGTHTITVTLDAGGSKTTHLGGMPTDALAQVLLLELITEKKACP